MFFNKKREEVVEVPEPTDPILPCGVEKVETDDHRIFLIDQARFSHAIEGQILRGSVVDPDTGKTTAEVVAISVNRIKRHIAMGWRNSDRTLHEMLNVLPDSRRR